MPYDTLEELPATVRNVLPEHAQEIYLAAFNNAWRQYEEEDVREDDDSLEEMAHKVAWAAVKHTFT